MSDNKDNLEKKLAEAKSLANDMLKKRQPTVISEENVVEVAKTRSAKDIVLWLIAVVALISSTLISQYLPKYWAPASSTWTQLGITAALVVFAAVCLAFTHQGRAFKTLLKDAAVELRRVTWPGKDETFQYTWQTIVMIAIVGFIVWLLDNFFTWFVGLFIG